MSYLKIKFAIFVLIGTALCAAEPQQKIYKIKYEGMVYELSLPHRTISREAGKRFTVVPQGMFAVMTKESPRDYLATFFCKPCVGFIIKHKTKPGDHTIIMAHQDIHTTPGSLLSTIKTSGIKEEDLHFTFYSNLHNNWHKKTVQTEEGLKSWGELHGTSSHQETFNTYASFYANEFPNATIDKILNPFDHPSIRLKRHAFIDATFAVGKDGSIFTFSPIAADITGMIFGPSRQAVDKILMQPDFCMQFGIHDKMSKEESLTIAVQALFVTNFTYHYTKRLKALNFPTDKVPFLQADLTEARK